MASVSAEERQTERPKKKVQERKRRQECANMHASHSSRLRLTHPPSPSPASSPSGSTLSAKLQHPKSFLRVQAHTPHIHTYTHTQHVKRRSSTAAFATPKRHALFLSASFFSFFSPSRRSSAPLSPTPHARAYRHRLGENFSCRVPGTVRRLPIVGLVPTRQLDVRHPLDRSSSANNGYYLCIRSCRRQAKCMYYLAPVYCYWYLVRVSGTDDKPQILCRKHPSSSSSSSSTKPNANYCKQSGFSQAHEHIALGSDHYRIKHSVAKKRTR